jgi:hypothetical protein
VTTPGSTSPIIILGAPRSGTNMLRDVLTTLPGLGTWPCDEINFIWRHGNVHVPHDELEADDARPEIRTSIRRSFDRIARRRGFSTVVEKTCANSLRVGFVDRVLPDARYVYLVRDGRDAAASALKRWRSSLDLKYTMKKARYVPLSDAPRYAYGFVANRVRRLRSHERRLGTWGPRFKGMDEELAKRSLIEVCALQWKSCVDRSDAHLEAVPPDRVVSLSYEDFIEEPVDELARVCDRLGVDVRSGSLQDKVSGVTKVNVGKWKSELSASDVSRVEELLAGTLRRHGYVS